MKSSKKLSTRSADIIERALTYARGGCPLQAAHMIGNLVQRIYELEKVERSN